MLRNVQCSRLLEHSSCPEIGIHHFGHKFQGQQGGVFCVADLNPKRTAGSFPLRRDKTEEREWFWETLITVCPTRRRNRCEQLLNLDCHNCGEMYSLRHVPVSSRVEPLQGKCIIHACLLRPLRKPNFHVDTTPTTTDSRFFTKKPLTNIFE